MITHKHISPECEMHKCAPGRFFPDRNCYFPHTPTPTRCAQVLLLSTNYFLSPEWMDISSLHVVTHGTYSMVTMKTWMGQLLRERERERERVLCCCTRRPNRCGRNFPFPVRLCAPRFSFYFCTKAHDLFIRIERYTAAPPIDETVFRMDHHVFC